jgi:hypothetical protein
MGFDKVDIGHASPFREPVLLDDARVASSTAPPRRRSPNDAALHRAAKSLFTLD